MMPKVGVEATSGVCCACGYSGYDEHCREREDGKHCVHWWEGDPSAVPLKPFEEPTSDPRDLSRRFRED